MSDETAQYIVGVCVNRTQFTAKYEVKILVWYEHYGDVREAIAREKQLKKWERRWKLELIERLNPEWQDLDETLNN